jgi:hypothetical protein
MPRDNHPRERQAQALARKKPKRPPFDRILIVTEGAKTELLYFEDIRKQQRIASAHIEVLHSALGTEPRQVVDFAHQRFLANREFDCVFAVFDRDDHRTYPDALARARTLDNKLRNDIRQLVRFFAVPTVPCFELWLLLHYQNQIAPLHRSDAFNRLKTYIPGYSKGARDIYALTEPKIDDAIERAANLRRIHTANSGTDPYTDVDTLVGRLRALRHP